MHSPNMGAPTHMLLCLWATCLSVLCFASLASASEAAPSDFDFSDYTFGTGERAGLIGPWLFQYGKLLSPIDAASAATATTEASPLAEVRVPADWNDTLPSGSHNPYNHGVATFVAKVSLPSPATQPLVLVFPRVADAYEAFWVSSNPPDQMHKIGGDGTMDGPLTPSVANQAFPFPYEGEGHLVLHVRKELQSYGGIRRTPYFIAASNYQKSLHTKRLTEGMIIGITLFVALLNLMLYVSYRHDAATLIIAVAALAMFLRALILSDTLEIQFGPDIRPFRIRLEYTGILLIAWTSYAVHQTLIWRTFSSLKGPILVGLPALLGTAFLFSAPLTSVTENLRYVQAFCVFTFVLILATSIQAIVKRQKDAWFYSLGWLIPLIAGMHDIHASATNGGVYLVNLAFVGFIIILSFKVGGRVTRAFNRADMLEKEGAVLRKLHQDALENARYDHLTGLLNRQALVSDLALLRQETEGSGGTHSLILFDIDHFKAVNDSHGHPAGDEVLRAIAKLLQSGILRDTDHAYRYGGEEFVVLLPNTRAEEAQSVAERIRLRIAAQTIEDDASAPVKVTASFGVTAVRLTSQTDTNTLVHQADQALHRAKASGRNQTLCFEAENSPEDTENLQQAS